MVNKAARNALKGYTYQNLIFTLLLAKMDTERKIVKIESEAMGAKNFDDAYVELSNGETYRLQVKNYDGIKIQDIKVETGSCYVEIKGSKNHYNPTDNNVFIVNSNMRSDGEYSFLGVPAINVNGILVVPLSAVIVTEMIENLYKRESRALQIIRLGYDTTSSGKYTVTLDDLPPVITFSVDLNQKTILVRGVPNIISEGVTYIEGKPGVGKSHFVNEITNIYREAILYRFWIDSQDPKLRERLQFDVFIEQVGLLAFHSPRSFSMMELVDQLYRIQKILIIDGLDHVENYNPIDLDKYIDFFDQLNEHKIRVLLLSRPLRKTIPDSWEKSELHDWSRDEMDSYLVEAHSISDYVTQNRIYNISGGYPLITYYLAEQYKKHGELCFVNPITDINSYYNELIDDIRTKSLLGIFAYNNSFYTFNELKCFFENGMFSIVKEFVDSYPYLFEVIENRVSLFHDSFNTFLRNEAVSDEWKERVNKLVSESLFSGRVEYMARLSDFQFGEEVLNRLLKQYADFNAFEEIIRNTPDYNSISSFYEQLQRILEYHPGVLDIYQYYSFSLIYQTATRNDLIGYEALVYQILSYISKNNGDIENQIFSSGMIWHVFRACRGDIDSLKRFMENAMYGEEQVYDICESVKKERQFFECMGTRWDTVGLLKKMDSEEKGSINTSDMLQQYLVAIWIQQDEGLPFYQEFKDYLEKDDSHAIHSAIQCSYHLEEYWIRRAYRSAKHRLHELGFFEENNNYRQRTLLSIIKDNAPKGSFDVASEILAYLRLANYENRTVDIWNINYLWCMYGRRKDYSVYTIVTALINFEKRGLIREQDSLEIINRLVSQSEKGIRHLLNSYVRKKGPEYTKRLIESRKIYDRGLNLDLFEIGPANIDCLPADIIKAVLTEKIRRNYRSKMIRGNEIRDVLISKHAKLVTGALYYYDMKVLGGLSDKEIAVLNAAKIEYIYGNDYFREEPYTPFRNGYINREDFDYIKQTGLSAMEVSHFTDGWHTCFPFVELYDLFDRNEIRKNYLNLIHQILFARALDREYIGVWNNIIGNIPAFLDRYEIAVNWRLLFNVLLRFMDLSQIYYPVELRDLALERVDNTCKHIVKDSMRKS